LNRRNETVSDEELRGEIARILDSRFSTRFGRFGRFLKHVYSNPAHQLLSGNRQLCRYATGFSVMRDEDSPQIKDIYSKQMGLVWTFWPTPNLPVFRELRKVP
jgi:hypothetical protein